MFISDACSFSPLCSLPENIIVAFAFLLHSASVATSVQISQTNAFPPRSPALKKRRRHHLSGHYLPMLFARCRAGTSNALPGIICAGGAWQCPRGVVPWVQMRSWVCSLIISSRKGLPCATGRAPWREMNGHIPAHSLLPRRAPARPPLPLAPSHTPPWI